MEKHLFANGVKDIVMEQHDLTRYYNLIDEDKLDEATDFRRRRMPKYIYKFYPLYSKCGMGKIDRRTYKTLKSNQIWCSKMECFNDPYEGIGYYYVSDKDIEKRLSSCLRIASFTENASSNISMWAYYANSHKGFCVKYEVVDNSYLYDVNYVEQRVSLDDVWKSAISKHSKGLPTDKEQLLIYEKYLIKHISWQNEKEYRIINATNEEHKFGCEFDCETIGLKPVKIYAGLNCTEKNQKMLENISTKLGLGAVGKCQESATEFILIDE